MIKIEKNYLETDRAITDINCVTHISWAHIEDGVYDVKLHFSEEDKQVIQEMSKKELEEVKVLYMNRKIPPPIEWRDSSSASFNLNKRERISIEDGIVKKERAWVTDLVTTDFITWRQDEESLNYMVKLHTGSKSLRFWMNDKKEINEIIELWKMYR